jgi:hypothetical protein
MATYKKYYYGSQMLALIGIAYQLENYPEYAWAGFPCAVSFTIALLKSRHELRGGVRHAPAI